MRRFIIIIIISIFLALTIFLYASSSAGPKGPVSGSISTIIGTIPWVSSSNITANDGLYSNAQIGSIGASIVIDNIVTLSKDTGATVVGNNQKKLTGWPNVKTDISYGGNGNLWGTTWSVTEINNNSFSALLSVTNDVATPPVSTYLVASTFGFSIPAGSTIDGIQIDWWEFQSSSSSNMLANVDFCSATVFYTPRLIQKRIIITDLLNYLFQSKKEVFSQISVAGRYSTR